MSLIIDTYKDIYCSAIGNLILSIQQQEFGVSITLDDQPDLLSISSFYIKGNGNFWVAVQDEKVVGTIALIDIGNQQVALRKMFVHQNYRGKERGVAKTLLAELVSWCYQKKVNKVFLGTIDIMHAAQRFYQKNGFVEIQKQDLPATFPLMKVDNVFFMLVISYDNTTY